MTDAFSAAAAQAAQQNTAPQTDQLTGNNAGYDPLFGGESMPSLFNEAHGIGVKRRGKITDVPFDKQSRFFKRGGLGDLKWWGEDSQPTKEPVGPNGARRPVMDTVIPLQTDYREALKSRDGSPVEDSGVRGLYIGGAESLKAFKRALKEVGITSREQLPGYMLEGERTGKKPAGDFEAWTWAFRLWKE